MSNYQIILIDPSTRHPELEVCEYIMNRSRLTTHLVRPGLNNHMRHGALSVDGLWAIDLDRISAILILGGGASPNDRLIWQSELIKWLTHQGGPLSRQLPLLGVCYGHQLLGHICGGKVAYLWNEQCEKGLREIQLSEDVLGVSMVKNVPLVVSHREGLVTLPSNWRSLTLSPMIESANGYGRVLAYEVIKHQTYPWWGIQAHIDATPQFLLNNQIPSQLPQPYLGKVMIDTFISQFI